ncbi:hypothetical protein MHYP_G00190390 [Metynnis hypsauchen]
MKSQILQLHQMKKMRLRHSHLKSTNSCLGLHNPNCCYGANAVELSSAGEKLTSSHQLAHAGSICSSMTQES